SRRAAAVGRPLEGPGRFPRARRPLPDGGTAPLPDRVERSAHNRDPEQSSLGSDPRRKLHGRALGLPRADPYLWERLRRTGAGGRLRDRRRIQCRPRRLTAEDPAAAARWTAREQEPLRADPRCGPAACTHPRVRGADTAAAPGGGRGVSLDPGRPPAVLLTGGSGGSLWYVFVHGAAS